MDLSINQFLVTLLIIVLSALACVFVGGWLVFRSKSSPGERLIGPAPKGTVFTIPDAASAPDIVDGEQDKKLLENTERFLSMLGGKS
jgi:cell division protein YceG involved in septum cleavage